MSHTHVFHCVATEIGVYNYEIRKDLDMALITFIPAVMYNKRRTNPFGIKQPKSIRCSANRAAEHHESIVTSLVLS